MINVTVIYDLKAHLFLMKIMCFYDSRHEVSSPLGRLLNKINNMTSTENLHYAIGELAYAVARADGEVQQEERKKFYDIIAAELRCKNYDFDFSDIIFRIMDKDKQPAETVYNWAM